MMFVKATYAATAATPELWADTTVDVWLLPGQWAMGDTLEQTITKAHERFTTEFPTLTTHKLESINLMRAR